MASSSQRVSASLSSTEPSAPRWKYDVFLSFRGIDTRKGITFELYDGLKNREGIETFMDDQELQVGAHISPSLLKAIEESRFAIIVVSPNYASSPWCLEELTKIVECMKDEKEDENRILPLFYHVEPSDVRHQKNSFKVALTKLETTERHDRETVEQWRYALKTVANFSGWETKNYKTERELVEDIVKSVCNKVGRQVADITKNLQTEVEKLSVAKATVDEKVNAARDKGEKIHANVQNWLKKVAEKTKEAEEFLKDEIQVTEEPHDSMSHRSKKSLELLQVVTELYEMREFSDISYVGRAEDACLASPDEDYEKFDSRVSTLEKIMKELASSSTDMILVYGIGGVGKTTLAEQVLRQAQKQRLFDDAIMVRDVKIPNVAAIQNQIADKLGPNILNNIQTVPGKADKINERIKDKNSLVILDDVWGEIDLKAVGLPHMKSCRILLTSRTSKLFSTDRRHQKSFQLGLLGEEETWLLFEKTAGNVVDDPRIRTIATQLAKKCGGLPVLIVTVASSLRNETEGYIWSNALRSLEEFDKEEELTKIAYLGLEWSYTQLNENLKPLCLLCGTIVEGNSISLTNLLKYGMGLGIFKKTKSVKQARDLLYTQVRNLKDYNLLLDGDDDTCVRMHDLVHHVVNEIASRVHHVLVQDGADDELKEWTTENLSRCSEMFLPCCNIVTLREVPWECPELEMFHLQSKDDDSSPDMPSNFFEEMKKLKVLRLNNLPPISLPPSLKCLENLQTLCLDGCKFKDIALVGELRKLQILSIVKSEVERLPKEIGQLTRLQLLDLSDCDRLEVISPGVISNLTSLEELRMRNSFDKWEGEGVICETSNARLLELKNLSKLTALEICICDADILPPDLFSDKLERYQIFVGHKFGRMYETTRNTLELEFTDTIELDRGLKMLLEKCDVLSLNGSWDFDFAYIINTKEVTFNYLTTLNVYCCYGLKCLSSSSVARNFKKLKHLYIFYCESMEQIISTKEHDEEHNMFGELKRLKLEKLPNLARFCTGKSIEFPLLEELYIEDCFKLGAFVGGPMIKSSRKEETRERDSEENFDAHSDGASRQYFIFDEKVRFPILEILQFTPGEFGEDGAQESELQTIWHHQLAPGSFGRLREVYVQYYNSLRSIFPPSMMGRLNALETLYIKNCRSVEVVFDERGETNVNKIHGTSTTQLKDGQNLISVQISECGSLKNIFPASMATGYLQQLQDLHVDRCHEMESIVAKEEGGLELTTPHPKFVFPKVKSLRFKYLPKLESFYPGLHTSKWPSLKKLKVRECDEVEFLAAELSIFQERHPHAPTKQPLFLIDQDSFPILEELDVGTTEIFYGQSPAESIFSRLKSIRFNHCALFSKHAALHFLQKLHALESLQVYGCPSEEIFVDEGNSSGEIHAVGSLPSVRNLRLSYMDNLMHLGSEKYSQPLFPNLEVLRVTYCPQLKNLESSAISFQKLTALVVDSCNGLECLIPYSIAKCLVHLTKMEATSCTSIVVIVASNGEDDAGKNEITFSQLQHLTLKHLPSLRNLTLSVGKCMHLGNEKYSQPLFANLEYCHRLKNLMSSAISFQKLTALVVDCCNGLECLIPYSIAKCLVHLTKMEVRVCDSIVVIVASDGDDDAGKNEITFSQLQHLTLEYLPRLQGFCSRNCIVKLPLSLIPQVYSCPIKLKISPDGVPIPERLKITEEDEGEEKDEDEFDDYTEGENDDETAK